MIGPEGRRRSGAVVVSVAACLVGATPSHAATPKLKAFTGCSALAQYAQAKASTYTGFRDPRVMISPPGPGIAEDAVGTRAPAPAVTAAPTADEGVSGTNNQEQGVDEPDIVKADARRMAAYTETMTLGNVTLYEHYGFKVMECYVVPDTELRIWAFSRTPQT